MRCSSSSDVTCESCSVRFFVRSVVLLYRITVTIYSSTNKNGKIRRARDHIAVNPKNTFDTSRLAIWSVASQEKEYIPSQSVGAVSELAYSSHSQSKYVWMLAGTYSATPSQVSLFGDTSFFARDDFERYLNSPIKRCKKVPKDTFVRSRRLCRRVLRLMTSEDTQIIQSKAAKDSKGAKRYLYKKSAVWSECIINGRMRSDRHEINQLNQSNEYIRKDTFFAKWRPTPIPGLVVQMSKDTYEMTYLAI